MTLYLDCFAGISGDMTLGALLDAGLDADLFVKEMGKLGLADEFELKIEKTTKWGISGTDVDVIDKNNSHTHSHDHGHSHDDQGHEHDHSHADNHEHEHTHSHDEHGHTHDHEHEHSHDHGHAHTHSHEHGEHSHEGMRGFSEIVKIIQSSALRDGAKARAMAIFKRLGHAEAAVHGTTLDKVHFHEVGAIDSIVDIVGASVLLDMLSPSKIVSSPIHVGSGLAHAAHGTFGVPAPATALILKGCPIYSTHVKGELCTPTGAAIAATMADSFGPMPSIIPERIGHGFGKKDFGILNFLRVFIGKEGGVRESVTLLEANIDDMTGEALGYAMDALLQAGAVDAWFEPIYMKKNRPAVKLCALAKTDADLIEKTMFSHTSTIGVRRSEMARNELPRKQITLQTEYGDILAKQVERPNGKSIKPEFDSVSEAATGQGKTYQMVYNAAMQSACCES